MRHLWVPLIGLMSLSALLFISCGESSTGVEGDALSSSSSLVGSSSSSVAVSSSSSLVTSSSSSIAVSSSSSLVTSSSSSVVVSSSSSLVMSSSSSVVVSSSSSLVTSSSSSVVIGNTQTCVYATTGTTTGSKGTLACAEKTYNTVVIGTQTWMAENLNYTPSRGKSRCYNDQPSNCTTYGRLYDWQTTMAGAGAAISSEATPSGVQGICPTGWHVPSAAEWDILTNFVGGASTAGTKLKANSSLWSVNTGTDNYGFSALPAGYDYGYFDFVGIIGYWWSTTETSATNAFSRYMGSYGDNVGSGNNSQGGKYSVRCLKD